MSDATDKAMCVWLGSGLRYRLPWSQEWKALRDCDKEELIGLLGHAHGCKHKFENEEGTNDESTNH